MFHRLFPGSPGLLFCSLMALLVTSQARATTRDEAIDIVVAAMIDTSSVKETLRAYALQEPIPPGAIIADDVIDTLGAAPDSSWFFWLDYAPLSAFAHTTQHVLVNVTTGAVDLVLDGAFWPTVDDSTHYLSEAERDTTSDLFWNGASEVVPRSEGPRRRRPGFWDTLQPEGDIPAGQFDACAIVVCPYDTSANPSFAASVRMAEEAFESIGVDVVATVVNKNKTFTTTLISTFDDCSKIYLYWTGHGTANRLHFEQGQTEGDRTLFADEFAILLRDLGADDYCVVVDVCEAGGLPIQMAGKCVKGFHMFSSRAEKAAMFRPAPDVPVPFTGGVFTKFWSDCVKAGLRGLEAWQWADSNLQAFRDSLFTSEDGPIWQQVLPEKANDGRAHYILKLKEPGSGPPGGEPLSFEVAEGCSTVTLRFFVTDSDPDKTASFTLMCETISGPDTTWTKKGTYNNNLDRTVVFRAFEDPNATGRYRMVMHSDKSGLSVLVGWTSDTSGEPTEPDVKFASHSVGWKDDSDGEFSQTLGEGSDDFYAFDWVDGTTLDEVAAHTGPQWFFVQTVTLPLEVDPERPEIYNNGDPAAGYFDDTVLIIHVAQLFDPETGEPALAASYTFDAYQIESGFEDFRFGTFEQNGHVDPLVWNLGTIYPEPLILNLAIGGPGVAAWDAIVMLPEDALVSSTDDAVHQGSPVRLVFNTPNPFSAETMIRFQTTRRENVAIKVYDARGRLVRTLLSKSLGAGFHAAAWDGLDDLGMVTASGVYFCRVEGSGRGATWKMMRLR